MILPELPLHIQHLRTNAVFSDDRKFRYLLKRSWRQDLPTMALIGLNPSTADERTDDPTVRRCISFAKDLGYGSILLVNLFAYRSTDPSALKVLNQCEVVGPECDSWIEHAVNVSAVTVAAWGNGGKLHDRGREVLRRLPLTAQCFGLTRDGHPRHPLYLPRHTQLEVIPA